MQELVDLDRDIRGLDWELKVDAIYKLNNLILNIHHSNDIQIIQSNQDINSHKSNALNSQSAFLKLSEYWLLSTNSFRVILLLVFSNVSCLSHSIAQPYDILHRISNVLESNDPVARALTIRVLGYLADIADTPELHHRILTALVDPDIDDFELSASIFTAIQLSIQNADFALSICTLLVCLPQSQNLGQLSKLLPVFEHLDRKITFAPLAVEIFKKMFEVHQLDSEEQLTLYLAMTKYSLKTLVLISSQIEYLLNCYQAATKEEIQSGLIENLIIIANQCPHYFNLPTLVYLLQLLNNADGVIIRPKIAHLLFTIFIRKNLFDLAIKHHEFEKHVTEYVSDTIKNVLSSRDSFPYAFPVVKLGIQLLDYLSQIDISENNTSFSNASEESCLLVEKWVQLIFGELEKDYKNQLPFKLIWKCFPFIKINSSMWNKCLNLLITENSQKISVFQIVRNGTRLPISMVLTAIKQSTSSNKIKYILLQSSLLEDEGNGELQSSDLGLEYENDLWSVYKIANLCMTKGFSNIANDLYPKLKCFSNDSYDWVKSLECISIAEKIIKENSKAISLQTLIEFKTKLTTKQPDTNFKSTPAQLETILKWLHQSNSHIKSFQAAKVGFGTFQSTYLEFQISFYYFIDQLCSYKIQMIDVYGLLERLKGMNDQLEKLKTGFYDLDTISFEALTHYNNMLTILSRLVLTVFPLKNSEFNFKWYAQSHGKYKQFCESFMDVVEAFKPDDHIHILEFIQILGFSVKPFPGYFFRPKSMFNMTVNINPKSADETYLVLKSYECLTLSIDGTFEVSQPLVYKLNPIKTIVLTFTLPDQQVLTHSCKVIESNGFQTLFSLPPLSKFIGTHFEITLRISVVDQDLRQVDLWDTYQIPVSIAR